MNDISKEERHAMRDAFSRLLAEQAGEKALRDAIATSHGYDENLWKTMSEMGLLGLIVDPKYGGVGGDAQLLEDLMEEAGAHLLCSPFISTAVIAASLISASSDESLKTELLTSICNGTKIFAIAATGKNGLWTNDDISIKARKNGDQWVLDGVASFVLHAEKADHLLVFALADEDTLVFQIDHDAVEIQKLDTNDPTLRLSKVIVSNTSANVLTDVGKVAIERALDLAKVALAGEHAGGAKTIFDMTVEYLKTRYQFGRQIGSYQSLKHIAADMLIEVESAASAARHAAKMLAQGSPESKTFISLAAFACADAYRDVSAQAIQLHGGIAYTWEHPAHLYWRRARTGMWLFGSSDQHREEYLTCLETI
ncbi:acyl-CoA dehydrogenase family protein [Parasphingorhabdus sp. JC815]|uniref:acyl-CoA dehydrogenase family protein n=1 Tax=Parasphingorhabdus sp. JC815 TaxID=3232140 RepID=UPI00345AA9A2